MKSPFYQDISVAVAESGRLPLVVIVLGAQELLRMVEGVVQRGVSR